MCGTVFRDFKKYKNGCRNTVCHTKYCKLKCPYGMVRYRTKVVEADAKLAAKGRGARVWGSTTDIFSDHERSCFEYYMTLHDAYPRKREDS